MSVRDVRENGVTRFKPYPAYKASGVEWLGGIPVHWELKRLKFAAHVEAGQSPPSEFVTDGSEGLSFLQGNADFGPLSPTPRQVCDVAPKRARAGDILLSVSAPVGAMNIADQPYGIGRGLCAIRPAGGVDSQFCFYVLATTRSQLDAVATGSTYDAVTTSQVGDLPALLPQLPEQRAIAAFLDRETARIDALVAKKVRLIELLQEKRIALITQAVTKGLPAAAAAQAGLDPNIPMKASGVEWLGEIPAHWEAMRIRSVVTGIEQGWSPECEARTASDEEWGVLKAGCVNRGQFVETEHKALPLMLEPIPALEIKSGDLLMSRASGSEELVGSVAWVERCRPRLLLSDKIFRLHTDSLRVEPRFLAMALNARPARAQIECALSGGSGLANNIPQSTTKNLVVAIPQLQEQAKIVVHLDSETAKLDGLIAKVREAIDRLTEFRTAVISAAVTGKIDVREPRHSGGSRNPGREPA